MQENELLDGERKGGRGMVIAFLIGLLVGAVGAAVAQPLLGRRLPEAVRGKYESLEGPVAAKQQQGDRLLLTVSTQAGAILATFKKRVDEINLLVEVGDTVAFDVPGYQPFMQNPDITRVAKPRARPAKTEPPEAEPAPRQPSTPADSASTAPEPETNNE